MGREECCKQITLASVGSAPSVSGTLGLPPLTACVLSLSTLLRLSRLPCRDLSEASPGLYAHPRSKPLSFGYSSQEQTWLACVLCPSQVLAARATRCLVRVVTVTYRLPWSLRSEISCRSESVCSCRCLREGGATCLVVGGKAMWDRGGGWETQKARLDRKAWSVVFPGSG